MYVRLLSSVLQYTTLMQNYFVYYGMIIMSQISKDFHNVLQVTVKFQRNPQHNFAVRVAKYAIIIILNFALSVIETMLDLPLVSTVQTLVPVNQNPWEH